MTHIDFTDIEVKEFHLKIMNNIRRIRKGKSITQLDLALTIAPIQMLPLLATNR